MGHAHTPGIVFAMPSGSSTTTFHQPVIALECERASVVPLAVEPGLVAELDGKLKTGQLRAAVFDAATAQGERRPRRRNSTSFGGIDAT
jgi:hypothetical protein